VMLKPKDSIHAIHGFNDRLILIAGLNFAAAEDRQISATRVNTSSPTRRSSRHLNVVAPIEDGHSLKMAVPWQTIGFFSTITDTTNADKR
jgi:hypothetical protein